MHIAYRAMDRSHIRCAAEASSTLAAKGGWCRSGLKQFVPRSRRGLLGGYSCSHNSTLEGAVCTLCATTRLLPPSILIHCYKRQPCLPNKESLHGSPKWTIASPGLGASKMRLLLQLGTPSRPPPGIPAQLGIPNITYNDIRVTDSAELPTPAENNFQYGIRESRARERLFSPFNETPRLVAKKRTASLQESTRFITLKPGKST